MAHGSMLQVVALRDVALWHFQEAICGRYDRHAVASFLSERCDEQFRKG